MKRLLLVGLAVGLILTAFLFFKFSAPDGPPLPSSSPDPETKSVGSVSALPFAGSAENAAAWRDPLIAIRNIPGEINVTPEDGQLMAIQREVETVPHSQVREMLDELEDLQAKDPTPRGHSLRMRLVRRWCEVDPASAADWLDRLPVGAERIEASSAVAGTWSRTSVADAIDWADSISDGAESLAAKESIVEETLQTHPTASIDLAVTLPPSAERDEMITVATAAWARHEPEEAFEWAKSVPDENLRAPTMSAAIMSLAETDPIAAGRQAVETLPTGEWQDFAVIGIIQRWAQTDITAARAWVDRFPEGDLRETALAAFREIDARNRRIQETGAH